MIDPTPKCVQPDAPIVPCAYCESEVRTCGLEEGDPRVGGWQEPGTPHPEGSGPSAIEVEGLGNIAYSLHWDGERWSHSVPMNLIKAGGQWRWKVRNGQPVSPHADYTCPAHPEGICCDEDTYHDTPPGPEPENEGICIDCGAKIVRSVGADVGDVWLADLQPIYKETVVCDRFTSNGHHKPRSTDLWYCNNNCRAAHVAEWRLEQAHAELDCLQTVKVERAFYPPEAQCSACDFQLQFHEEPGACSTFDPYPGEGTPIALASRIGLADALAWAATLEEDPIDTGTLNLHDHYANRLKGASQQDVGADKMRDWIVSAPLEKDQSYKFAAAEAAQEGWTEDSKMAPWVWLAAELRAQHTATNALIATFHAWVDDHSEVPREERLAHIPLLKRLTRLIEDRDERYESLRLSTVRADLPWPDPDNVAVVLRHITEDPKGATDAVLYTVAQSGSDLCHALVAVRGASFARTQAHNRVRALEAKGVRLRELVGEFSVPTGEAAMLTTLRKRLTGHKEANDALDLIKPWVHDPQDEHHSLAKRIGTIGKMLHETHERCVGYEGELDRLAHLQTIHYEDGASERVDEARRVLGQAIAAAPSFVELSPDTSLVEMAHVAANLLTRPESQ